MLARAEACFDWGSLQDTAAEDAALMFTGGFDSTLTAFVLAHRFRRVHLLTFDNGATVLLRLAEVHARELEGLLGPGRLVHSYLCTREVVHRLREGMAEDMLRCRSPFVLDSICKLAMATRAVTYCRAEGVRFAADGTNREQSSENLGSPWISGATDQDRAFLDEVGGFMLGHGVRYLNPVYDFGGRLERRAALESLGLSVGREAFAHLANPLNSRQPFCLHQLYGAPCLRLNVLTLPLAEALRVVRSRVAVADALVREAEKGGRCPRASRCGRRCDRSAMGRMEVG